jgi:hypothetical protein
MDNKKELKKKLREKLLGSRINRMSKVDQMSMLKDQCEKVGITPEQMMELAKTQQKKRK